MIGYALRETRLQRWIEEEAPGWLARAQASTASMQVAGRYLHEAASWSEIKRIYMRLQHHKCGYCERKLSGGQSREHDIEHFRPKQRVDAYPDTLGFETGPAQPAGYYLLALHPLNYVVACKTCNSDWKKNYFPIAGVRIADELHPREYAAERPYLIYPLGLVSEGEPAPEQLITFDGILAVPAIASQQDEHQHRMGRVTIRLLGLNREGLLEERARILVQMFPLLEQIYPRSVASSDETVGRARSARQALARFTDASAPHTSCARAFEALFQRDPDRARLLVDGSRKYLKRLGRY